MDNRISSYFGTIPADLKRFSAAKVWSFDFSIYEQFVGTLHSPEFATYVTVSELPRFLVKGLKHFLSLPPTPPEVDLPESMMDTLLPFQLQAVEFVLRREGRAMIADEMGCGKTIEALAVLLHYRRHLPALIMCPPNLIAQWQAEVLDRCGDVLSQEDVCVVRNPKDKIYGKISIISYTMLENFVSRGALNTSRFGIVIADESHSLKTKDAKRTTLALPLLKRAKVSLCLTGTPAVNRPVELFTQLNAIRPDVFDSYETFTQRYCDPKKARFHSGMDVTGASNEAELKSVLDGLVMIRRLKSEVIRDLPGKSREVRRVQPDAQYLSQLKELKAEMEAVKKAANDPSNSTEAAEMLNQQARTLMNRLCRVTGMSKIQQVTTEIERLVKDARDSRKRDLQARAEKGVSDEVISHGTTSHESGSAGSKSVSIDDVLLYDNDSPVDDPPLGCPDQSIRRRTPEGLADGGRSDEGNIAAAKATRGEGGGGGAVVSVLEDDCLVTEQHTDPSHTRRSQTDDVTSNRQQKASKRLRRVQGDMGRPVEDFPSAASEGLVDSDDEDAHVNGGGGRSAGRARGGGQRGQRRVICLDGEGDDDNRSDDSEADPENGEGDEDDDEDIFFSKKTMAPKKRRSRGSAVCNAVTKTDASKQPESPGDWRGVLDYREASKAPTKKRKKTQSDRIISVADSTATGIAHNPSGQGAPIGQKILVFAHHAEVMDAIENCLRQLDVGYIRIDGKVTVSSRTALISRFQNDDQVDQHGSVSLPRICSYLRSAECVLAD